MKKIYFVTGVGCSGKTTFAKHLSQELGIPSFKADDVYWPAQQKLDCPAEEMPKMAMYKTWAGKYDWKEYQTPQALFRICYDELFSYNPPDSFVIDGTGIFLNKLERDLLLGMFPDYEKRYLVLRPSYEQWLMNRSDRRLVPGETTPRFLDQAEYDRLNYELMMYVPKDSPLVLRDRKQFVCSPTGGRDYQSPDFSDPKWAVFDFPKDMKGMTFLDVSCNGGWFCHKASQRGAKVHGLDISWQVLDRALDLNPKGNFQLSKVEDFDSPIKFDYLLCSSAFHYYHDREQQIAKFARLSNYVVIEMPVIDTNKDDINYQGGDDNHFCSVVSKGLMEKWLNRYFKKVQLVGHTDQPNSKPRPVWLCQEGRE